MTRFLLLFLLSTCTYAQLIPQPPIFGDWPIEVPHTPTISKDACPDPFPDGNDWMVLSGSNCTSDGLVVIGRTLRVEGNNIYVKNFEVNGNGVTDKVGVRVSGSNIVLDSGKVYNLLGNDRHCYTALAGSNNVWIINSEGYYCSGDGFQAGHQASTNPPTNFYLVRNTFHDTRENGIDLKYMTNVIAVENTMYNFNSAPSGTLYCLPSMPDRCTLQNSGSDGSAIIIGSDGGPSGWAFYRNTIYNAGNCIRVEESPTAGILDKNTCTDIVGTGLQLDKNSGRITFSNNRIENANRGIFQNWRENFSLDVDNNLFINIAGSVIEYEQRAVFESSTLTNNIFINIGPVIYGNTIATTEEAINNLPGSSGNTVN